MSPHSHNLLSTYLSHVSIRMFPPSLVSLFSYNPLRSPTWFRYAVHDEAMLCAMLYSAAVHVFLLTSTSPPASLLDPALSGRAVPLDREAQMLFWQGRTLNVVSDRLRLMEKRNMVDDSTLSAISCLALGEAVLGNQEQWHVHMRGLRYLLLERSTAITPAKQSAPVSASMAMSRLSPTMRNKLRRSDISGAVDYNLRPYLSVHTATLSGTQASPHIWSFLPLSTINSISASVSYIISPAILPQIHYLTSSFLAIFTQLAYFIYTVSFASTTKSALTTSEEASRSLKTILDPYLFSNDFYSIQSALLTPPSSLYSRSSEDTLSILQNVAQKALRLAGLLYLKSILQEFPHSVTGPKVLLLELRSALQELQLLTISISQPQDLQIHCMLTTEQKKAIWSVSRWTGAIGMLVGRGEIKVWFRQFLAFDTNLDTGGQTEREKESAHQFIQGPMKGAEQGGLEKILDLERVFGFSAVKKMWHEVETLASNSQA